jgi:hypothetical protein
LDPVVVVVGGGGDRDRHDNLKAAHGTCMATEDKSADPLFNVEDPDRSVVGSCHQRIPHILKRLHPTFMTMDDVSQLACSDIVHFDGGIVEAGDDLIVVELQAGDDIAVTPDLMALGTVVSPVLAHDMVLFVDRQVWVRRRVVVHCAFSRARYGEGMSIMEGRVVRGVC